MAKRRKKNNEGFTLVELLASLVILALLTVIAAPNVIGILQNTKLNTYVDDAKKLASLAEYKFRGDSSITKPTSDGHCTVMSMKYLGDSEFQSPPYGGKYLTEESFVAIKKTATLSYEYYVQLVECKKSSDDFHTCDERSGIPFINRKFFNDKKKLQSVVGTLTSGSTGNYNDTLSVGGNIDKWNSKETDTVICSEIDALYND